VQPHREFAAEGQLNAQAFTTFLPVVRKTVRHARAFRSVRAPFFPGYLFVKLALGRDRWRSVNGTYGVSRLVMAGELPQPVPHGVVEALQTLRDRDGLMSFGPNLRIGERAQILSGPFAGRMAELIRLPPSGRVQVLLELMGSPIAVSVAREVLAPAAIA
jgi:transcriptional antiterminator RfaH